LIRLPLTIRCLFLGLLAIGCAPAIAQSSLAPCATDAAFTRLPGVDYACIRLSSGGHMLVAQTQDTSKPSVVLVHGLGSNAHRDWRYVYPALAEQFHLVMLDLPGFGNSTALPGGYSFDGLAKALDEATQRVELTRFHVVGHSLGAAVSLFFADRYPARVDRLVLIDAAGVLQKQVFARQLLQANRSATLDGVMGLLGQGRGDAWIDLLEDQVDASSQLLAIPAVRNAVLGMPLNADAALGLVEHDFTAAIRNVHAPTTLIWGQGDTVTPLRTGQVLLARMPDARLQIVEGAQHMPAVERPEATSRLLLSALGSPLQARQVPVRGKSQGDVSCRDQPGATYTGTFDRLSLSNCANARIERAFLQQLVVEGGSVDLVQVAIDADAVALQASNASVVGTGMTIVGDTAVRASNSRVDLAGVSVRARKQSVEAAGSRIYFSVSDIDSPEYRGDAHFRWPPPK
jgi:pimeloyl-ACP methyl ester carboxylesterase